MPLSKPARKIVRNGKTFVLVRTALTGKSEGPAEPPAEPNSGGAGDPKPAESDKKYTDADVNKIARKHKADGEAAAAKKLADQLGMTVEEATAILTKHKQAEDANKSEAERERAAAAKEREAAEAAKREAGIEIHEARIERALAGNGLVIDTSTDEGKAKLARIRGMVTAQVGASYDDVLADVQALKKDFPAIFDSKAPEGTGGNPAGAGRMPNSDPKGTPPRPTGGEDKYSAGAKRFHERNPQRTYNPLAKEKA